ncbi:hypothetical protein RFI_18660 [Reticulomyxa filosa]|uniref:Uncharacterized protein n=1 Tax=Reticulomyxa filosa TaxID=46433 RepID=X6MZV7_RETFI|nr:hypothetical protein RFI_18660 [Reticulomyxa filosa]|eukprot:ETO18602.1 hypothetical protein RFI_18660 [Reticulomyxa filosa]
MIDEKQYKKKQVSDYMKDMQWSSHGSDMTSRDDRSTHKAQTTSSNDSSYSYRHCPQVTRAIGYNDFYCRDYYRNSPYLYPYDKRKKLRHLHPIFFFFMYVTPLKKKAYKLSNDVTKNKKKGMKKKPTKEGEENRENSLSKSGKWKRFSESIESWTNSRTRKSEVQVEVQAEAGVEVEVKVIGILIHEEDDNRHRQRYNDLVFVEWRDNNSNSGDSFSKSKKNETTGNTAVISTIAAVIVVTILVDMAPKAEAG